MTPGVHMRGYSVGLLLAIVLLGTAVRLYQLDADSFWADEIITARTSLLTIPSILSRQSQEALNPPLTFLVTRFFFSWGGQSEFTARLPSALLGSLSILLIYAVGETLWTHREGIIAAVLLAVSPQHVEYSQEARHYALMVFLALLSVLFLLKALKKNKVGFWAGFVVCTTLALYTHYFALLILPAELIFGGWVITENYLSYRKERASSPRRGMSSVLRDVAKQPALFLLSLLLVAVLYLPWASTLQAQVAQQTQPGVAWVSDASLQASLRLLGEVPPAYAGASGIVLLLWFAVLLLGLATADSKQIALSLVWMGTPFLFLGIVPVVHAVRLRYILFTLPIYLLVAARGISSAGKIMHRLLRRGQRAQAWPATLVPAIFVLILGGASALSTAAYYLQEKENWRDAARYLADSMATGDIVLADGIRYGGGDAQRVSNGLSYYLTLYGAARTAIVPVGRHVWEGLHSQGRTDGHVWGVVWNLRDPPPAHMTSVVDFYKVSIIRPREPSGDAIQDTLSLLHALLEVLPPEAHFDIHLALEEIYLWTGRYDQAQLELDKAEKAKPGSPQAARDLAQARAELEEVSRVDRGTMRPSGSNLGGLIALLGYGVDPKDVGAGESLLITLQWQALMPMDKDYTLFIHLVSDDGRIWAQHDRLLEQGGVLTSAWRVGQLVTGQYRLEVPSDAPAGEYSAYVGLYHWQTGQRLPPSDGAEDTVTDNAILLSSVTVRR